MQMPPPQMMMGRGAGPAGQQVAPGQMMINGQEPLNPSNRNRPTNSPQSYSAYDKETEGEGLPPPHFSGVSSQSVHTRPRNASNPVPPTAADAVPLTISLSPASQQVFYTESGNSFDDGSLSKEMGVHGDQVSLPSIASEDVNDKQRRSSGPRFNLGHRRNSSGVTGAQQGHADAASEKKKNFFSSVTGMGHSQPKPKSNLGLARPSTFDEPDQVSFQNSGKGRLSELKGMIKGVGNAKEGAKDDQPVRIETVYEPRLSMQGPPRNEAVPSGMPGAQRQPVSFGSPVQSGPFGSQAQTHVPGPKASMQPHPSQMGQPVTTSPSPFVGVGRASTASPQPSQVQQVQSEENGKKSSSGGFLGGLFGKQGNKMKDVKLQSPQQIPPSSQRSPQPPSHVGHSAFRPGQMPLPGQQLGPHPMLAGQPPIQRGPPGQSPSPTLFQDPAHPPPSLETAQAITIRRPSEITLSTTQSHPGTHQSSSQRPNMPSPQGSQSTFKQQAVASPLGQRSIQIGMQNDSGIMASQTSPRLSDDSSLEKPTVGNPSGIPRFSPNRKPVGSGISKGEGAPMTSVVAPGITGPDRSTASPSPRPIEQRAPSQLSQVQHTSQGRSSGMFNDMRQPSLPSPEPSPVPSQSNPSSSPRIQGDQFARHSLDPRESGPALVFSPMASATWANEHLRTWQRSEWPSMGTE
ncbi:hypothetical protein NUW58_g9988 [Xylaria curta]|uniref:Uncharacterized protein n=1 Tax=Xylaria curta TaxID=42375 RepID=A0ACC1MR08_9PEZI|nr:hypothetical protein NUW58_g9988 [Xylaria curta]